MPIAAKQLRSTRLAIATTLEVGESYRVDITTDLPLTLPPNPLDGAIVFIEGVAFGGILTLDPGANTINGLASFVLDTARFRPSQVARGSVRFAGGNWTTVFEPFEFISLIDTPDTYESQSFFVPMVSGDQTQLNLVPPAEVTEGVGYDFSTVTASADPGPGNVSLNNADPLLATEVNANEFSRTGSDVNDLLSAYLIGDVLEIHGFADRHQFVVYRLTSAATLQPPTNWVRFEVQALAKGDPIPDGERVIMNLRNQGGTFIELDDSPDTYTGEARRVAIVDDQERGLRFEDPATAPRGNPYDYAASLVMSDPGPGNVRLNNATQIAATQMAVHDIDNEGNANTALFFGGAGDTVAVFDGLAGQGTSWDITALQVNGTFPDVWGLVTLDNPVSFGGNIAAPTGVRILGQKGNAGVATSFLQLIDTPNSYVGQAGNFISVNGAATAIEFTTFDGVPQTRTITTGDGLSGGGNMTANRTHAVDGSVVRTSRNIATGDGLTGGGNLSANRTFSVDASVMRVGNRWGYQRVTSAPSNEITTLDDNTTFLEYTSSTELHRIRLGTAAPAPGRVLMLYTPGNCWLRRDRGGNGSFGGMTGDYRRNVGIFTLSAVSGGAWIVNHPN